MFDDTFNITTAREGNSWYDETSLKGELSFVCWSTLRSGKPHFPESTSILDATADVYGSDRGGFGRTWNAIQVHYDRNCTDFLRTATDISALESSYEERYGAPLYKEGDCAMGESVYCTLHDEQPAKCRLNVRMSAAFILAGGLVLKAAYMLSVNLLARGKLKSHCLTFGDVIVASASDPELRIQGYERYFIQSRRC